jgi:NADH:ubiquinone oxidoreductase subunit
MGLLLNIFTWWHGPGLGTRIMTRRHGNEVGRDAEGNIYYRRGAGATERRWVIYNGTPEATRIPPEWHLWMHKTVALPPTEAPLPPRIWERPWTPNATGTDAAYLPSGSLDAGGKRAKTTGDYRAWSPEGDLVGLSPEQPSSGAE